jgi:hypothetical protein
MYWLLTQFLVIICSVLVLNLLSTNTEVYAQVPAYRECCLDIAALLK